MRRISNDFLVFIFTFVFISTSSLSSAQMLSYQSIVSPRKPAVDLDQSFTPTLLEGLIVYPDNPLSVNFIIVPGQDLGEEDRVSEDQINEFAKYFLASLTIPEEDIWVNLSPYEKEKIIPDILSLTAMGREMLEQDYILKKLSAAVMSPETPAGEDFWKETYRKAVEKYGTIEIPIQTFNKIWIIPDKAVIYENENSAYIAESHMKVMLEEDLMALDRNFESRVLGPHRQSKDQAEDVNALSSQVVRDVLVPVIEKEVNEGRRFAKLRQIYNAMILATWYKRALKESLLKKAYVNQEKVGGIALDETRYKEEIYTQYFETLRQGVVNFIREEVDPVSRELVPRKYFSGGITPAKNLDEILDVNSSPITATQVAQKFRDPVLNPNGRLPNIAFLEFVPVGDNSFQAFWDTMGDLAVPEPYLRQVRLTLNETSQRDRTKIINAAMKLPEALRNPEENFEFIVWAVNTLTLPVSSLEAYLRANRPQDWEALLARFRERAAELERGRVARLSRNINLTRETDGIKGYQEEDLMKAPDYPEQIAALKELTREYVPQEGEPLRVWMINSSIAGGVGDIISAFVAHAKAFPENLNMEWFKYDLSGLEGTPILHYLFHGKEEGLIHTPNMKDQFIWTTMRNAAAMIKMIRAQNIPAPHYVIVNDPQPAALYRILQRQFPEFYESYFKNTVFTWFGHIPFEARSEEAKTATRFLSYFVDTHANSAYHDYLINGKESKILPVSHPVVANLNSIDIFGFYNVGLNQQTVEAVLDHLEIERTEQDVFYTHNSRVDPLKGKTEALEAFERMYDKNENAGKRIRIILTGPVASDNPGWEGIEDLKSRVDRINAKLNARFGTGNLEYAVLRLFFATNPEQDIRAEFEGRRTPSNIQREEEKLQQWSQTRERLRAMGINPDLMVPQLDKEGKMEQALGEMSVKVNVLTPTDIHQIMLNALMTLPVSNLANSLEEGFGLAATADKLHGKSRRSVDEDSRQEIVQPGPVPILGDTGGLGRQLDPDGHGTMGFLVGIRDHDRQKGVTVDDLIQRDQTRREQGVDEAFLDIAEVRDQVQAYMDTHDGQPMPYVEFMVVETEYYMTKVLELYSRWQDGDPAFEAMGENSYQDVLKNFTTIAHMIRVLRWMDEPSAREVARSSPLGEPAETARPLSLAETESLAGRTDTPGGILFNGNLLRLDRRYVPSPVPGMGPDYAVDLPATQNVQGLSPHLIGVSTVPLQNIPVLLNLH